MSCWEAVGNEGFNKKKEKNNFVVSNVSALEEFFFFFIIFKRDRGIGRKLLPRLLFHFLCPFTFYSFFFLFFSYAFP